MLPEINETPVKCNHCPVRVGLTCLGEGSGILEDGLGPLCRDVANGLPGRAEQLVTLAEGTSPGLMAMAGSFARSAIAHAANGSRLASPEVQAERKRICFACSHLDKIRDRCNICGCIFMDTKRSWASERCPLDPPRWDSC